MENCDLEYCGNTLQPKMQDRALQMQDMVVNLILENSNFVVLKRHDC